METKGCTMHRGAGETVGDMGGVAGVGTMRVEERQSSVSPPKQDDKNSSINKNPNAQQNFQVSLTHMITCNTRFLGEI
ncbi:hypothetical protein L1887_22790 [Cichorium endivia]|nr:hypothetical protein L1887_22790 [Cichorium endivia]